MTNAVDFINEKLDPMTILTHYGFNNIEDCTNQIRACCAIHNGNNPTAFCWNKTNNLWFCYTGDCGGGDVYTLVEKIEKVGFVRAVEITASILGLNIDKMQITEPINRIKKEHKQWLSSQKIKLKRSFNIYQMPYTTYYDSFESFTRFNKETIAAFNSKFCKIYPTEDYVLKNKLIVPIYHNNDLVGVTCRELLNGKVKWCNVPNDVPIHDTLYNYDNALQVIEKSNIDEVIVVEGIFDVWKFYQIGIHNVVAIFGSHLYNKQLAMLLQLGVNITLCFDNDKAGIKCTKETTKLLSNKTLVKFIELPENKDPADCSDDELLSAYINRS
jgi:DNA primase